MRLRSLLSVALLLASLGVLQPLGAAETHTIDTVHSSVLFKIRHMGASNTYGRFNQVSGKIVVDEKDPKKGSVDITVKSESVDTGNEGRDKHLKGPDFLNTKQFSTISFKGNEVSVLADGHLEVSGQLTLHGVTKDLKVKVEKIGSGKGMKPDSKLTGFEAKFTIKRSDFDMKFGIPGVGDEVELTISVECDTK